MSAAEVLRHLNFQFTKLIYGTNSVQVYAGTYGNYPVVFKVLSLPPNIDYQLLEKEYQILLHMSHENVVKVYHHQWIEWNTVWYLVIVMEACEKNLAKDIESRNVNNYPYSEQELWSMLVTLVRAFAYMQRQGLAHRDIKPLNIFLSHGVIKIGDFGSARYLQTGQITATLIGTPVYLSPLLKQAIFDRQQQVVHNVYKSDVYSLGMTFLELTTLQPPPIAIEDVETLIRNIVWGLNYSEDMKRIILWMLAWDEANRPDFVELDDWITGTYPQLLASFYAEEQRLDPTVLVAPTADSIPESLIAGKESMSSSPASGQEHTEVPQRITMTNLFPPKKPDDCHAEEKKGDSPRCLYCQELVQMRRGSTVVQLECSPLSHVYCSPKCLSKDIAKQKKKGKQPVCSVCKTPIEDSDLAFYDEQKKDESTFSFIKRWILGKKPG